MEILFFIFSIIILWDFSGDVICENRYYKQVFELISVVSLLVVMLMWTGYKRTKLVILDDGQKLDTLQ